MFSVANFQGALKRMRPSGQAAGYDGYRGVLLRWATFATQERYRHALIDAHEKPSAPGSLPDDWPINLVSHIPKPGKSVDNC